ncbi:MAG TPA: alanine racemase [Acidisphaera sp.]|nr:alanine racemase [Acidisphaera sp.]
MKARSQPPAGHAARLTVDLDAIAANWRTLRDRHGAPTAAVVKADGYGLGAIPIAARLYAEGCRHFFVAHLAEARAVRPAIPSAFLAVLNGLPPGAADAFLDDDIAPVLGTLAEIDDWASSCRARGRSGAAMLHVDTGMNRLGLPEADVALGANPDRLRGIDLRYVMTHLVSSEAPEQPVNAAQHARFASACAHFPHVPTSFANSSGIFLGDAFRSDLARPGAALYGINPTPGRANPMAPAVTLHARVLQLRDLRAGDSVGYNATFTAAAPMRLAVAGIGYADGWLRSHSNRGAAFFDGVRLPLVGRVSMDLTTYDASAAPHLRPGDWIELIGPHCTPDDAAEAAGTNGYEVLTALARRCERIYTPA